MIAVNIHTENLKTLEDFFGDLSVVDERKIFLSAYKKASAPAIEIIRSAVPVYRGNLWRSIGTKAVPGEAAIWLGSILNTPYVKYEKGTAGISKVWYGLLTEGGTKDRQWKGYRRITKGAHKGQTIGSKPAGYKNTGHITGIHWFQNSQPVWEPEVYGAIEKEWYDSIERFIKKTNAKMT